MRREEEKEIEHDEEIGRWQQEIYKLVIDLSGHEVDGSGCDSGDPLDLTLSEIRQGFSFLTDRIATLDAAMREKDKRINELESALGNSDEQYNSLKQVWIKKNSTLSEQITTLTADRSDAWCLAFNLWPGDKEPSDLDLCGVINELSERYKKQIAALTADSERLRNQIKESLRLSYLGNLSEVQQFLKET